jgi:hypothetical protein
MATSVADLVVTVTSHVESVAMVTSVVRAEKVVEIVLAVRSLRHHQSFHSVQSQSASSHVA